MITANHFVNISGVNFKFVNYDFNKQTVILVGNPAGFSQSAVTHQASDATFITSQDSSVVSDQVGFTAPPITGDNINSLVKSKVQIALSTLRGKYVFVDFWSTYCAPCIEELPNLNAVYKKYPRSKFDIIGIFDERNTQLTQKLFVTNKVAWPNILMNSKTTDISGYGHVDAFPTNYLIDPSGKIIGYNIRQEDLMNKLKIVMGY